MSRQERGKECGLREALSAKPIISQSDCHRQSFQKPKWSSIPRQCAHWHGICWMRGFFRRKRRNPASLNEVRAGRILKEGGLVCGSKPFSASLSRILAELLGGTRSSPPEAPSRKSRQGFSPNPSVSALPSQLPFQGSRMKPPLKGEGDRR